MDAVSYAHSAKQAKRIKKFIENPDSNSGIVTVPKVIGTGENITIPAGRVAVLPNVQVDGTLNIEGEVFIPSGATFSKVVEVTGDQTIEGVKTFSSSPVVPTPTTGTQAANMAYADLKVALTEFIGSNQSLTTNGYQKLPGGLIIQWGTLTGNSGVWQVVTYPIAFPNNVFAITTPGMKHHTVNYADAGANTPITIANTSTPKTNFRWGANSGSTSWGGYYIAIGY